MSTTKQPFCTVASSRVTSRQEIVRVTQQDCGRWTINWIDERTASDGRTAVESGGGVIGCRSLTEYRRRRFVSIAYIPGASLTDQQTYLTVLTNVGVCCMVCMRRKKNPLEVIHGASI